MEKRPTAVSWHSFQDGTIEVGATVQLSATATDAGGADVESATFTWASSDDAVATVSSSGLVTGVAGGRSAEEHLHRSSIHTKHFDALGQVIDTEVWTSLAAPPQGSPVLSPEGGSNCRARVVKELARRVRMRWPGGRFADGGGPPGRKGVRVRVIKINPGD